MITIRPAAATDEGFLLGLTNRLSAFPVPHWRSEMEIAVSDHHLILGALAAPTPDTSLLIAELEDGRSVACILTTTRADYFTQEAHAHVEVLAVDESAEGRGIGRALMDAAEGWAVSRGYRRITLNVFAANERARGVYEHLGYEPETVRYHKVLGPSGG
ncbi:MAG: GNAT family N-acetyltransferase [Gemmatimonadota bacterium]